MSLMTREAPLVERQFLAMGTPVVVRLALDDGARRVEAERAVDQVRKLLVEFGVEGWAWGSGALAQFNRQLSAGGAAEVPPLLRPLLQRAWRIHRDSEGWFDPRIEREDAPPPGATQVESALRALRRAPPYDGGAYYGPAPGIAWDLGAIGKGYIVDMALDWLRQCGFASALINAGGNVATRGRRDGQPWCIGIRDPRSATAVPELLAALDAGDESVITHGDDQRFFEHGGERYTHLLQPRSGAPAQGLRSLTVVHHDGTLADAGGAALFAAGPTYLKVLAARLGLSQILLVRTEGTVQATASLAKRLQAREDLDIQVLH
jgi:thiamine biosynthesis lipoprotein